MQNTILRKPAWDTHNILPLAILLGRDNIAPFQAEAFQSLSNTEINIFQSPFIQAVIQFHI